MTGGNISYNNYAISAIAKTTGSIGLTASTSSTIKSAITTDGTIGSTFTTAARTGRTRISDSASPSIKGYDTYTVSGFTTSAGSCIITCAQHTVFSRHTNRITQGNAICK